MSGPEMHMRKVGDQRLYCEVVTPFMLITKDPVSGLWIVVDWASKRRAAFKDDITARLWCRAAFSVFVGVPNTNAEIQEFHDSMTGLGWRIGQYLNSCFMWDLRKPLTDAIVNKHAEYSQRKRNTEARIMDDLRQGVRK